MFEQLPETNPVRNNKKLRAFVVAVLIQAVLVTAVIAIQMVMPEKFGQLRLLDTLYMAPPPRRCRRRRNPSALEATSANPRSLNWSSLNIHRRQFELVSRAWSFLKRWSPNRETWTN